jgi:hypothetical protein
MPAWIVLAPDGLAQSKRRLCSRRRSTAVVIQNYRKLWLSRIFTLPLHQDIEEGVVRLPNRIGSLCLPAVHQVEKRRSQAKSPNRRAERTLSLNPSIGQHE